MTQRRRVLVTGSSGFIGQTVCRRLRDAGRSVVPLDLREGDDLVDLDLRPVLDGVDAVIHLAGSPGVQTSWAKGFDHHVRNNVVATQRLLEAALDAPVEQIVVASSSSVYGNVPSGRASEELCLSPLSPYGASKAAMEHVVGAYVERGLPVTPLRLFTVYGPGQRPDMAMHRMIEALAGGPAFTLRGDGSQSRNFTFVDDAARAIIAATDADLPSGRAFNVGGGGTHSVSDVLDTLGELAGKPVPVTTVPVTPGDPVRTAADTSRILDELGWAPEVGLREGLAVQLQSQLLARTQARPDAAITTSTHIN